MNTIIRRFFKLKTNLKRIPNPKATKKVILPTGLVVTTKLIRGIYLIDVEHVKAQRWKKPLEKWNILSPDGFTICPFDFDSKEEAWKHFNEWKKGFERQGYYSTVKDGNRLEIPLNQLKENCKIEQVN